MYIIFSFFFISFYSSMNEGLGISTIEQYVIDFVLKLRLEKELTQTDIATILGIGRTFITNVENEGHRAKYNLSHIDKLANHFGMSPQEFLPKKSLIRD